MNQTLDEYINKARKAEQTNEQIKNDLLKAGWKIEDVNGGLDKNNNYSENMETILSFFRVVSLAYIFIVPLFLFLLRANLNSIQAPFYLIVSSGGPIFPADLSIIIGIYLGPISIVGGILGLISVSLIRRKKIIGLIILTILIILGVFLTIDAWINFVQPYFFYHSSTM